MPSQWSRRTAFFTLSFAVQQSCWGTLEEANHCVKNDPPPPPPTPLTPFLSLITRASLLCYNQSRQGPGCCSRAIHPTVVNYFVFVIWVLIDEQEEAAKVIGLKSVSWPKFGGNHGEGMSAKVFWNINFWLLSYLGILTTHTRRRLLLCLSFKSLVQSSKCSYSFPKWFAYQI